MSVFAVITTDSIETKVTKLDKLIQEKYKDNAYKLENGGWLLFDKDTVRPKDVFDGIFGEDSSVSCLVLPFESYWGVQPKTTWEWLKIRLI